MYIDISRELKTGMAVWPGDTAYHLEQTMALGQGDSVKHCGIGREEEGRPHTRLRGSTPTAQPQLRRGRRRHRGHGEEVDRMLVPRLSGTFHSVDDLI